MVINYDILSLLSSVKGERCFARATDLNLGFRVIYIGKYKCNGK